MQSGVVIKSNGAHPPPDRLRLRIVEMAEKRSQSGSGNRSAKKPSTPLRLNSRERNIDVSKLEDLRNVEREIKGEVYRPTVVTRVGQNKERINLDVPKTPKPGQEQQSLSPYHRVVVLDARSHSNNNNNNNINSNNGPSNKDRASARLLKRFRQRRLLNGDEKSEISNTNEGLYDTILPSQYRAFTAVEPSKRFRAPSGTVIEKPTSKEVVYQVSRNGHSTTPDEEADASSLSPTTHFPSNDSADAKKQGRIETNKVTSDRRYGQTDSASRKQETKSTLMSRDKQGNPNRLSELRGNALATPPPRQNGTRKPGLFSASLEAFRRRLRLTANKYSERLNNENVDRTEEYVIRPEPQVTKTGVADPHSPQKARHRLQFPRFEPKRHMSQQRPSSETSRIEDKPKQPYQQNPYRKDYENNNLLHSKQEVYTLVENHDDTHKDYIKNNSEKYNIDRNNNETGNVNHNFNNDPHNNEDSKRKETTRKSSIFTITSNKNGLIKVTPQKSSGIKELLSLDPDDASTELDSDALPCVTSLKQPVPKVKTYVVMNAPNGVTGTQAPLLTPQPPPRKVAHLTEHNMRLHESLLAMYERRAQRMARYQKRQRALQQEQEQQQQQQQHQKQQHQQQEPTQMQQDRSQIQQHCQRPVGKDNIGDHDSDKSEESADIKRIRKWVRDVSEQFVFPVPEENVDDVPLSYLAQPDLAVESAIQFENPLSHRSVVCC